MIAEFLRKAVNFNVESTDLNEKKWCIVFMNILHSREIINAKNVIIRPVELLQSPLVLGLYAANEPDNGVVHLAKTTTFSFWQNDIQAFFTFEFSSTRKSFFF